MKEKILTRCLEILDSIEESGFIEEDSPLDGDKIWFEFKLDNIFEIIKEIIEFDYEIDDWVHEIAFDIDIPIKERVRQLLNHKQSMLN